MTQNEEDKTHVEAVRYLLHYAIKGRVSELHKADRLPTLLEVNQATGEVLNKAVEAGLLEEDSEL